MTKNSTSDRDDRLAAATVTVLVFAGGILSLFLLGSAAARAIA